MQIKFMLNLPDKINLKLKQNRNVWPAQLQPKIRNKKKYNFLPMSSAISQTKHRTIQKPTVAKL